MDDFYQTVEINKILIHRQIFSVSFFFYYLFAIIFAEAESVLFFPFSFRSFVFLSAFHLFHSLYSHSPMSASFRLSVSTFDIIVGMRAIAILTFSPKPNPCVGVCLDLCVCEPSVCNQCRCEQSKLEANGIAMYTHAHQSNQNICMLKRV